MTDVVVEGVEEPLHGVPVVLALLAFNNDLQERRGGVTMWKMETVGADWKRVERGS